MSWNVIPISNPGLVYLNKGVVVGQVSSAQAVTDDLQLNQNRFQKMGTLMKKEQS